MKKFFIGILVIASLLFWFGESRKFFMFTNGEYITLWKTYGNISFIVPGKYYGLLPPSGNRVRTSNINSISFYIKRDKCDTIYFNSLFDYSVENRDPEKPFMVDLKTSHNQNARIFLEKVEYTDFKNWSMLRFDIRENYAMDENRKIQK